jgi:hypothetical protein
MRFTHLDTNERSLQLAAGTLELRLMQSPVGTTSIDTPSISIKPQQGGQYRVSVTADGQTLVTVRSGDAQIDTPQGGQDITAGTTLVAQGDAANPTLHTQGALALDDFDRFNAARDQAHAAALGQTSFVNADIDGVDDLAANGRWVTDGAYGHVWIPAAVGPDWAPYRDGRWVWEDGYGWTWIADEPWGWAPYHYGSWYHSPDYGWCWYPPQPRVYVPWRPALVAFIGFGAGADVALGFGGGGGFGTIGWVPLAPFEPYHPWWGNRYGVAGPTSVTNITTVTNVTNVTTINVYRNVNSGAVSSVSSQRFLQGNFNHNIAVPAAQLRSATVFTGAPPIVPTASNLRFSRSAAPPALAVNAALVQRSFVGHAVTVARTPFTTQRVAFAAATHATLTPLHFKNAQTTPLGSVQALPPTTQRARDFAAPPSAARTTTTTTTPTGAWSRFNQAHAPANQPVNQDERRNNDFNQTEQTGDRPAPTTRIERPASSATAPSFAAPYHAPAAHNAVERFPAAQTHPLAGHPAPPASATNHGTDHPATGQKKPAAHTEHDPAHR